MKLTEDRELLEEFRRGTPNALEQVYLHYAPQLYTYLQKGFSFSSQGTWYRVHSILDPVEQENLVQETFIRCFSPKARMQYDGERPYLPYLQRTCQRIFIGQKRLAKRFVEYNPELDSEPEPNEQTQQEELEKQELLSLLKQYLETCDEREQRVFEAIFERNESQKQAAERLEMGRMQVRTSLQKIRRGLIRHFRETGYLQHVDHSAHRQHINRILYCLFATS